MKYIYINICVAIFCSILFSCTTTQTISVLGEPGTTIYTPEMDRKWTVQNDGNCKITLESQNYYPYLLSKNSNSELLVPFALDYSEENYTGTRLLYGVGFGIAVPSVIACGVGTVGLLLGEEALSTIAGVGMVGGAVGAFTLMVPEHRLGQDQQAYSFKYLSEHNANDDLVFTPIVDNGTNKGIGTSLSNKKVTNREVKSSTAKSNVSKSSKTLNDYAKQISGTYIGKGNLIFEKEIIENYSNIKVVISREDKNTVAVSVIENNGDEFFTSINKYDVTKKGSRYTLTLQDIPSAKITINGKQLKYNHPKVNIDNDIYTLDITATKK